MLSKGRITLWLVPSAASIAQERTNTSVRIERSTRERKLIEQKHHEDEEGDEEEEEEEEEEEYLGASEERRERERLSARPFWSSSAIHHPNLRVRKMAKSRSFETEGAEKEEDEEEEKEDKRELEEEEEMGLICLISFLRSKKEIPVRERWRKERRERGVNISLTVWEKDWRRGAPAIRRRGRVEASCEERWCSARRRSREVCLRREGFLKGKKEKERPMFEEVGREESMGVWGEGNRETWRTEGDWYPTLVNPVEGSVIFTKTVFPVFSRHSALRYKEGEPSDEKKEWGGIKSEGSRA